jgi:phage tail-like protein
MPITDPATTIHFTVNIDGFALGLFTACDGLGAEIQYEDVIEGGNNDFVHHLPNRVTYTNIKLTRPVSEATALTTKWLAKVNHKLVRTNAEIVAQALDGKPIVAWHLHGVVPVRWTGPSFNSDSPKVATETLELSHQGFLGI